MEFPVLFYCAFAVILCSDTTRTTSASAPWARSPTTVSGDAVRNLLNVLGIKKELTELDDTELVVVVARAAEKYAQLQAACGEDDQKFDAVTYCNRYRKEVERFEALFKRLIADSPSLNTTLNEMVPLFQEEREAARGQIRMDLNGVLDRRTLFEKCSRVEKWRIILTWFSLFLSDGGTCMLSAAVEEQLLEKWRNALEHLKPEVEKNFETFINGGIRYCAIENLPLQFKEEFKVLSEFQSTDCSRFNAEIRTIGRGFHDGFHRCSAQVKKIEELKTPPDQLFIVRARISGLLPHLENSDDSVIHRCLSSMVEVGDNSRRI